MSLANNLTRDARRGRKNKDLEKLRTFFITGQDKMVLTHARIALDKGITEAYRITLESCIRLKDINTAERIVRFGLKRGISPLLLYRLLANVYLETDELDKYLRVTNVINELTRKKEEVLRKFTS